MKKKMQAIIKREFSTLLKEQRKDRHSTQAEMAEYLHMSDRAYAEMERGKSVANSLAIVLCLIREENQSRFLSALAEEFDRLNDSEDL